MGAKELYDQIKHKMEALPAKLDIVKTTIAENRAIEKKKAIYESVSWSKEQQKEFDDFWVNSYGKTIPNKWHRLYQACSGSFAVDYIPEKMYTTRIEPAFNDATYARALEDKGMVELLSYNCGCVVPKTLVVCSGNQFYDGYRKPISREGAIEFLEGKHFIIKPSVDTSSGKGITIVNSEQTDTIRSCIQSQGKDFIVQELIKPHPVFAALNPSSINTIRITTFIVKDKIHHVPLALRIGRAGKSVDNIHAGGLVIGIEDDGTLLPYAYELGYGDKTTKYDKHPDSGVVFSGYKMPEIDRIIESAYRAHGRYLHTGIISWDYTVDENSNPILIEANIMGQSVWIAQMIHGKGVFGKYTKYILERIR